MWKRERRGGRERDRGVRPHGWRAGGLEEREDGEIRGDNELL